MRVVSLVPSATEILARIGGIDTLVGRSHECDHPSKIAELPVLTAQKTTFDPASGVGSAEVDAAVRRAMIGGGESLYTLDTDLLADLRPDVVLTQDLCEVCSIDLGSVRGVLAGLESRTGHAARVLALSPETIEGVLDDHLAVGRAVGMEPEAAGAVFELRSRLHAAEAYVNPYTEGPVVGFLEWTDPLFIAGHWTVQLIERAGGRHPLNETVPRPGSGAAAGMQAGERIAGKSIRVPPGIFAASGPEFLVISPCGLSLEEAVAEARRLAREPWWADLPAVRAGRVAAVDGNQMFSRPGPRLVDAFEWLVGWLNDRPEIIPADFPWTPLD